MSLLGQDVEALEEERLMKSIERRSKGGAALRKGSSPKKHTAGSSSSSSSPAGAAKPIPAWKLKQMELDKERAEKAKRFDAERVAAARKSAETGGDGPGSLAGPGAAEAAAVIARAEREQAAANVKQKQAAAPAVATGAAMNQQTEAEVAENEETRLLKSMQSRGSGVKRPVGGGAPTGVGSSLAAAASGQDGYSVADRVKFRNEVIEQLNLAREKPKNYVKNLMKLKKAYQRTNFCPPAEPDLLIPTTEGENAVKHAILHLSGKARTRAPVAAAGAQLDRVAAAWCATANNGKPGAAPNSTADWLPGNDVAARLAAAAGVVECAGPLQVAVFGATTAAEVVAMLLVNDGDSARKTRDALLQPNWTVAGVGTAPHKRYGRLTSLILAESFVGNEDEAAAADDAATAAEAAAAASAAAAESAAQVAAAAEKLKADEAAAAAAAESAAAVAAAAEQMKVDAAAAKAKAAAEAAAVEKQKKAEAEAAKKAAAAAAKAAAVEEQKKADAAAAKKAATAKAAAVAEEQKKADAAAAKEAAEQKKADAEAAKKAAAAKLEQTKATIAAKRTSTAEERAARRKNLFATSDSDDEGGEEKKDKKTDGPVDEPAAPVEESKPAEPKPDLPKSDVTESKPGVPVSEPKPDVPVPKQSKKSAKKAEAAAKAAEAARLAAEAARLAAEAEDSSSDDDSEVMVPEPAPVLLKPAMKAADIENQSSPAALAAAAVTGGAGTAGVTTTTTDEQTGVLEEGDADDFVVRYQSKVTGGSDELTLTIRGDTLTLVEQFPERNAANATRWQLPRVFNAGGVEATFERTSKQLVVRLPKSASVQDAGDGAYGAREVCSFSTTAVSGAPTESVKLDVDQTSTEIIVTVSPSQSAEDVTVRYSPAEGLEFTAKRLIHRTEPSGKKVRVRKTVVETLKVPFVPKDIRCVGSGDNGMSIHIVKPQRQMDKSVPEKPIAIKEI